VSPEFRVISVSYHYEAAVAAGSDHAVVVADLAWSPRPVEPGGMST
jgi:hypothetical protein